MQIYCIERITLFMFRKNYPLRLTRILLRKNLASWNTINAKCQRNIKQYKRCLMKKAQLNEIEKLLLKKQLTLELLHSSNYAYVVILWGSSESDSKYHDRFPTPFHSHCCTIPNIYIRIVAHIPHGLLWVVSSKKVFECS